MAACKRSSSRRSTCGCPVATNPTVVEHSVTFRADAWLLASALIIGGARAAARLLPPLYAETARSTSRRDHGPVPQCGVKQAPKNYDDFNEFFWRTETVQIPLEDAANAFRTSSKARRMLYATWHLGRCTQRDGVLPRKVQEKASSLCSALLCTVPSHMLGCALPY